MLKQSTGRALEQQLHLFLLSVLKVYVVRKDHRDGAGRRGAVFPRQRVLLLERPIEVDRARNVQVDRFDDRVRGERVQFVGFGTDQLAGCGTRVGQQLLGHRIVVMVEPGGSVHLPFRAVPQG